MKRTSMFIFSLVLLASVVCEVAWAQCPGGNCSAASYGWNYTYNWFPFPFYYPYQTYQAPKTCSGPACQRAQAEAASAQTVPATVDEAESVPAETPVGNDSEAVPAVVDEPGGNPSLEPLDTPTEEPDAEPVKEAEEDGVTFVEVPLCPFAARVIALINQQRAQFGLPALKADQNLVAGCQNHSAWMSHYGFQHAANGGRECIAMGVNTPESLVNLWMNSSGHRAIIMGWGTWIGIGSAGTYHTLRIR